MLWQLKFLVKLINPFRNLACFVEVSIGNPVREQPKCLNHCSRITVVRQSAITDAFGIGKVENHYSSVKITSKVPMDSTWMRRISK